MNDIKISFSKTEWGTTIRKLAKQFGIQPDLQAILFIIGVQELGKGYKKFSQLEKQELMHIAVCKLFNRWGYYELKNIDKDGWPHWESTKKLPTLAVLEQENLLKQSIIEYFKEI